MDTACKKIIVGVVDKTWYKELEDPDTFYTTVTALKILDHITKFYLVIHTLDAVNIRTGGDRMKLDILVR